MTVSISEKIAFIESVFGKGNLSRDARNFDVRCPICAPLDPSKKKLSIYIEDDRNHCWTCGFRAHNLALLIRKHSSNQKLQEYIEKYVPDHEKNKVCRITNLIDVEKKVELPKDFRLLVSATTDPDALAAFKYVSRKRGLSERDMWYFKLGISNQTRWHRRIIVPSFDVNGSLNYFVARAIDSRRFPKYDGPDHNKLGIIFNEINVDWQKELVLCEGAFDAFKCGENVVPLLGSDLNKDSLLFEMIVSHKTPIALALDANMWETKTLKVAKLLTSFDVQVKIVDTRPFDDPGNASKEQFKEALSVAAPFDWSDSLRTKLGRATKTSLMM